MQTSEVGKLKLGDLVCNFLPFYIESKIAEAPFLELCEVLLIICHI